MAKRQSSADKFRAPAEKYVGQLKVGGGPAPIQVWQRPYTRAQHDRPLGAEGVDLRPERPENQTAPPANVSRRKRAGKGGA